MTRVLLLEDNPKDQRLVQIALAEAVEFQHEVVVVETLEAAIDYLDHQPADVVLADLNLPDSSGLDTMRRLVETHPETPIIVLTGLADDDLGDEAIRLGAQDFLVKGKMFGELLFRAIRYAKERHQIIQELRAASG